jgi:hypothetical protein
MRLSGPGWRLGGNTASVVGAESPVNRKNQVSGPIRVRCYGMRVREFTNRFINRSCLAASGVHKVVAHPADRACLASTSVVFANGGARDIGETGNADEGGPAVSLGLGTPRETD